MPLSPEQIQAIKQDPTILDGMPDDVIKEIHAQITTPPQQSLTDQLKMGLKKAVPAAVDVGKRSLDLLGGAVRTAAWTPSSLISQATGGEPIVKGEDYVNVLKGNAPSWKEYAGRVPGSSMGKGLVGSIAGTAGDIASDIIGTAGIGMVSPAAKALVEYGQKPFKAAAEALGSEKGFAGFGGGKYLYKQTFKNADKAAGAVKAMPVSEIAMKHKMTGTAEDLEKQMLELLEKNNLERTAINTKYAEQPVNITSAVDEGLNFLRSKQKYPGPSSDVAKGIQNEFKGILDTAKEAGLVKFNPNTQTYTAPYEYSKVLREDIKTLAENPNSMFNKFKTNDVTDRFVKKVDATLNNEATHSIANAGTAEAALDAQKLREINKESQSIIEAKRQLYNAATSNPEARIGAVDALGVISPEFFLTRQAINLSKVPLIQTKIGNAMIKASKSQYTPYVFKRGAIDTTNFFTDENK